MKLFDLKFILLILFLSFYCFCSGQDDNELYSYEFRIFRNGKSIKTAKGEIVKAYIFNFKDSRYEELEDSCAGKDKFCYRFYSKNYQNILLKIYSANDSMCVYTSTSFDSLQFLPGEYNYSYSYSYIPSIIPFDSNVRIIPANVLWQNYPKYKSENFPGENSKISVLKIFDPDILKIDPTDHIVYAIHKHPDSYQLHVSKDFGNTWTSFNSRFLQDRPENIRFTEEGNYIQVVRNNEYFYFPLEEYFSSNEVKPVIFKNLLICILKNEDLIFEARDINESQMEGDTCSSTILIGGNQLFELKQCNAKYFDLWDKKMKYLNFSNPYYFFEFKGKKILVFKHFLLFSTDDITWYYFPKSDFYSIYQQNSPKYSSDFLWAKKFYWIEGKGLLAHLKDTGLYFINVNP